MNENRIYIAINLKSFYTSVKCMERQLAPSCDKLRADAAKTKYKNKLSSEGKT